MRIALSRRLRGPPRWRSFGSDCGGRPETNLMRLVKSPVTCIGPGYVAEELLRAVGFTDIRHIAQHYFEATARRNIRSRPSGRCGRSLKAVDFCAAAPRQEVIAVGTDWPFLDEVRKPLKG
jgi:hypothetical protein